MKNISYVLAALASIAIAAPALAQDKAMEKPTKPMMHHHRHHHVHMHHHMKKPMMDKKM